MIRKIILILLFLCVLAYPLVSASKNLTITYPDSLRNPTIEENNNKLEVEYGDKGWQFSLDDGRYVLQIDTRFQFRYAYPFDSDPVNYDDFSKADQHIFKVNRARLKIGGNAYHKWLKYYLEYELAAGNLLDFRVMVEKWSWMKIKAGQWKAQYNRERIISSGKQQLADRSLLTRYFTIDRQQGISAFGRLEGSGLVDFNYWLEILTGNGRGASENDDTHLMYMVRTQWNFLGNELKFSGSDLSYHKEITALIALGLVTNRSPYTRFSQEGGGNLEGFDPGVPGQYRVNQSMLETALMYRGFSWQQELHWKEIDDKVNQSKTTLIGNYFQFGYFLHNIWSDVPRN